MLPQINRNPLLPVCLAFAAGSLTAGAVWLPAISWLWTAAFALSVVAALILLKKPAAKAAILVVMSGLFFLCGLIYTNSFLSPDLPPSHLARLIPDNGEVTLSGKLISKPVLKNNKTRLVIETESVLLPLADSFSPAHGLAALTVDAPEIKGLEPGRDYLVRARLSLPNLPATPGVFDYAAHLAVEGIRVKGWVETPVFIQQISSESRGTAACSPKLFLENHRLRFAEFFRANLAPENAALYQALLIGDQSGFTPKTLERYRAAGIMHILAISGAHLVVVAFLSTLALRFFITRFPRLLLLVPANKIALAFSFPVLLIYAGLAGFQPPVVRALAMTGVFMTAILLDRQWSSLNNLAIAALAILIANPLSIRTASFQLSFAAAAAIILVMPALPARTEKEGKRSHWQNAKHFLISSLTISGAAFLATAPLALFHFNRLSLLGPVSTLLVTPFLCFWTLPLGLLAIGAQPFSHGLSLLLLKAGIPAIRVSDAITAFLAELPFASFWLPTPSIFRLASAFILIITIFRLKRFRSTFLLLAGLGLVLSGYTPLPASQKNFSKISFLAVGDGSATVIEAPDGEVILIDGGGPPGESFNTGERIIAPFLWHRQIRRVDQIVITSPRSDHFNGLPFIIRRFKPKIIWLSAAEASAPGFAKLLKEAAKAGCALRIAGTGEVLVAGKDGFSLTCLINPALSEEQGEDSDADHDPKNRGLVLRLAHGGNTFLFPGDIGKKHEYRVLGFGPELKTDVLFIPHHGLGSSGSPQFIEAVGPDYIVASTGEKNPFPTVQPQGRKAGIFSTARHGSVFFLSDGKGLKARTYRPGIR